jgi:hypothetical protein
VKADKYIIKDGIAVPCYDLHIWGSWYDKNRHKYHKSTRILNIRVSTIFLGLDHSWNDEPVLWETMIFDDTNAHRTGNWETDIFPEDLGQWRFSDMNEAYKFHGEKVREFRSKQKGVEKSVSELTRTVQA